MHDLFKQTLAVFRNIFYLDSYLPTFTKTKRGTIIAVNSLESTSPLFSLCVSGSLRKLYRVRSVLGKDSGYEFKSEVGGFFTPMLSAQFRVYLKFSYDLSYLRSREFSSL